MPTKTRRTKPERPERVLDEARIQELRESVKRLEEDPKVDFIPRWGKALHDRTRLTMLGLMNVATELTTTELQAVMRLSQPNVSRHLAILKLAGIVGSTNRSKEGEGGPGKPEDGRRTYYSVRPALSGMLP